MMQEGKLSRWIEGTRRPKDDFPLNTRIKMRNSITNDLHMLLLQYFDHLLQELLAMRIVETAINDNIADSIRICVLRVF